MKTKVEHYGDFDPPSTTGQRESKEIDPRFSPYRIQVDDSLLPEEMIKIHNFANVDMEVLPKSSINYLNSLRSRHVLEPSIHWDFISIHLTISSIPYTVNIRLAFPTTEQFEAPLELADFPKNLDIAESIRIIRFTSLDLEEPFDIINSTDEVDYVISEDSLDEFLNNLKSPSPERVQTRLKTLKEAREIYERFKGNL